MTINYEGIGKVLEAWAKPHEDEICQQVRVAWLMENWSELGNALQEIVPVEYAPLMNAEEMAAYVHEETQAIVDKIYKPIGADIPVMQRDVEVLRQGDDFVVKESSTTG